MRTGILLFFLVLATLCQAHEPVVEVRLDSVSIVVDGPNKAFIIHEVLPKQTLYTIARAYGVRVEHLYQANSELRDRLVKMNEQIKVPLVGMEIKPTIAEGPKAYYRVRPKETAFRLARIYFGMEIEHLLALNNLSQPTLEVGQKLLLGTLTYKELTDDIVESTQDDNAVFENSNKGLTWKEEKSVAFWHKHTEGSNALFVLHDEAPVNSLVEITNPVFGRTIQAKVIGRIPEGAYTRDIDVILSHGVADQLGAIDPRLYVKMKYLK